MTSKNFHPFEYQFENESLLHSKAQQLLVEEERVILDSLWESKEFNIVLENLEKFKWQELTEVVMIYYCMKLRNINFKEVQKSFKITKD